MSTIEMLIIVCPLVFLASLVDAIAGGGGLIALPAYLSTGMPAHLAIGSNKFSSCTGTVFSTYRFFKNGSIHLKVALLSGICALIGSALGARLTLLIRDDVLRIIMMILLPFIAIIVLIKKKGNDDISTLEKLSKTKLVLLASCIGFFIGMYDGFYGPGTGTFVILAYTTFMGFDFKTACGNAKVVNLSSNFAALVVYMFAGKIMYTLAVPAAFCSILGHWIGSGLAINKGAKFIKPVLVSVLIGLFIKIILDMIL